MLCHESEGGSPNIERRRLDDRKNPGQPSAAQAPPQARNSNSLRQAWNRRATWHPKQHSEASWSKMMPMQYLVIVEKSENGFGAYVPDLPGCVAAATSHEEVMSLIQEAIEFHIEGLIDSGEPVPAPISQSALVDVHAA